jgi:hypothetical protein
MWDETDTTFAPATPTSAGGSGRDENEVEEKKNPLLTVDGCIVIFCKRGDDAVEEEPIVGFDSLGQPQDIVRHGGRRCDHWRAH